MSTHTTTAGKVKVSLALSPHAYQLLKGMSPGPRAVGALLDDLLTAEAARRASPSAGAAPDQALSRRLVELQERERRALSRDLHDTSGQGVTALKLGLGSLKRAGGCSDEVRARVDELLALADTVSEDLHRLAVNLRPSSLDRYGLVPALEQLLVEFQRRNGIETAFEVLGDDGPFPRLAGDVETALYRIVQESLTNIARYARATLVSVMLQQRGDQVVVIAEDDGVGFDVDEALRRGRLGLVGMRERAELLGGSLEIESSPGQGTTIYASVPAGAPAEPAAGGEDFLAARPHAPHVSLPGGAERVEAPGQAQARPSEAAELARVKALSDALVDITQAAARCSNADEVLRLVLARSAEAIGRDNAHIAVRGGGGWELRYAYRDSMGSRRMAELDTPAFEWVDRTRQVLVVNDTSAAETPDELRLETRHVKSYACIPLLAGDRLLGVLSFVNYAAPAAFHASEVEFLDRLAALAALALENARLNEAESRQRDELARRVLELETLLELLPVGVAIAYDPLAQVIRVNPALARLLGVEPGANVSLNPGGLPRQGDYRIFKDGRELPPEALPMQRAARGEVVRDMIVEIVRGDGAAYTMLASAVPLLDATGRSRGAVGSWWDITELRRAEAVAEEASRTLETLLEYIPEGITIADGPDARLRRVSLYGQELLGGPHERRTASEVAGQWAVYEADGVTPVAEDDLPLVRAIRHGETVRDREIVQINAEGRGLPLLCNAGPIRDRAGRITGGVVAWRDISVLKAAQSQTEAALAALSEREATLAQSEERYRSLFSSMTEGFALHEIVTDEAGRAVDYRFLAVNPAFERLTGLKREEVEGMRVSEVLPGNDPYWLENYARVALTGEAVHFENYASALRRWYDVYAYSPAPRQFAVIFTEITSRKRTEEHIIRLNEDLARANQQLQAQAAALTETAAMLREASEGLEQRVKERTEELAAANVRLLEANWAAAESEAALQNLSRRLVEMQENERHTVANELYNDEGQRLAALIIELGRLQKGGLCAPAVESQIEHMIDLTDGVLADMHRLAMNLRPAALDRLGLGPALREAFGRFGLEAGVRLQVELAELDGFKLPAEIETNTYRIVQEVLANVARHAHATRVSVTAIRRGDGAAAPVILILEDDGAGFDVEAAQANGSLGLLAMRERAEAMGGAVTVESAPGQGTTVYIEVPVD